MMSQTSIIEGIGDEVLIVTGVLFLMVCMFIAWVSTQVHWENRPLTLLVFRQQQQRQQVQTHSENQSSPVSLSTDQIVVDDCSHGDSSDSTTVVEEETPDAQIVVQTCEPDTEQNVRQRCQNSIDDAVEVDNSPSSPNSIQLRLKFLDERQKIVRAQLSESIFNFKRKHFQQELSNNENVRLIYKGKELKDNLGENLEQYGLTAESTIHCLVTRRPPGETVTGGEAAPSQEMRTSSIRRVEDLDISGLMFPLFGLILGLIWYFRFSYRQYFNVLSTFALIGISLLFFVAAYASYTHRSNNHSPITPPIRIHHINVRHRLNNE